MQVDVITVLHAILCCKYPGRIIPMAHRISELHYSGDDLRNAIGGQKVRNSRDDEIIGNTKSVQSHQPQAWRAIHEDEIVSTVVQNRSDRSTQYVNRIRSVEPAGIHRSEVILDLDQIQA